LVILLTMTVLPLGDVKSHLSEIVGASTIIMSG
jgi:hypothetical protein